MGKLDIKLISVVTADVLGVDVLKNNKVMIFTSSGTFIGRISNIENLDDSPNSEIGKTRNIIKLLIDENNRAKEAAENSGEFLKTTGYIILEDVIFLPSGSMSQKIKMPFIQIFADQIVAISLAAENCFD